MKCLPIFFDLLNSGFAGVKKAAFMMSGIEHVLSKAQFTHNIFTYNIKICRKIFFSTNIFFHHVN